MGVLHCHEQWLGHPKPLTEPDLPLAVELSVLEVPSIQCSVGLLHLITSHVQLRLLSIPKLGVDFDPFL